MNYISTRDKSVKATAAEAIARGISDDGGLFVPDSFPHLGGAGALPLGGCVSRGRAGTLRRLSSRYGENMRFSEERGMINGTNGTDV